MTDRVNMRMAGVPERSFRKYASGLVRLGYRVGRVEQMETGIAAAQRKEESGGKNSICAREMCQILTCGTLVEEDMLEGPDANLLLIVHEAGERRFGICLAECSSGEFWLGQFDDDSNYTQLETVLLRHRPREVVWPKDAAGLAMLSKPALKLIKGLLPNASFVALTHETEFWSAERTKTETFTCGCFEPDASGSLQLPPVLSRVLADPASSAALRAWGGALSYLRSLLLEGEVVPGASVADYCEYARPRYMQLDGHTLNNLELLRRPDSFLSAKSDTSGSLLSVIDRTCTAMGRRLLHQWICSPLAERAAILQRQTAVAFFAQSQDALSALTRVLRPLPDLDRAIVRLQAQARKKSHGVMFDDATAREVQGLVAIVDAFYSLAAACTAVKQHLQTHGAPSLVGVSIPATLDSTLSAFVSQFNLKRARSDSTVAPEPGVNPEYDASAASLDGVIAELNSHLEEVKRTTKCKDVDFYSAAHGKEPFQLEFPAAWIDRNGAPASMTIMSQTKTVKRYWDSRTKALVQRYRIAHEAVECAQQGTVRALMAKLSDACAPMKAAVAALAHLDCLMSLSHTQVSVLLFIFVPLNERPCAATARWSNLPARICFRR
jgi:DNA mismatch repair protein MSH6